MDLIDWSFSRNTKALPTRFICSAVRRLELSGSWAHGQSCVLLESLILAFWYTGIPWQHNNVQWYLQVIWSDFNNPYHVPCPACDSVAAKSAICKRNLCIFTWRLIFYCLWPCILDWSGSRWDLHCKRVAWRTILIKDSHMCTLYSILTHSTHNIVVGHHRVSVWSACKILMNK